MSYILYISGHLYRSIFIVGDLHGCHQLLMRELVKLNFSFEQDLLICTGDLIDRGPENLECVALLQQKWFRAVRGNHEEMCIKGPFDPQLKYIHQTNGGKWFYRLFKKTQQRVIHQLAVMPIVIELQLENKKIGILHADIDHTDWNTFKAEIAETHVQNQHTNKTVQNALWGRGRIRNSDGYHSVSGIDAIYLGHTVVKQHTQIHNCHYIDTGSSYTQQLCLIQVQ